MNKYICVHGHFYQPPRENPWLNEVEIQESAAPFHDWNERITDECYARNSASRILDAEDAIVDIVNNYSRISFNFGPTLLEWMEKKAPETYQAILEADKESQKLFSGHGSAIAQVYNHLIMPLANLRDKHTQVIWGIYDFKKRFGRDPEGMWLGETAADTETLEVLAEHGIKFTILSPYQANRYRKIGEKEWHDAVGANIDPRRPYLCNLPSGKTIVLFFYDGPVSQGIAFEGLLNNGERLKSRLLSTFDNNDAPQLMHIATDGETYGHHHRFGEMALSFALDRIEKEEQAKLTVYGEYIEKFPPTYEAYITENTSWSCAHGVERWRSDCGCNTGGNSGWNQAWRGPLRASFDWVRDELEGLYEEEMTKLGAKPWEARNTYIQVIMDRSKANVESFIKSQTNRALTAEEKSTFLRLLEMQYHTLLMYTSCGWFFDEVTGIETVQDIFYAARALQLAHDISGGKDYETKFLALLEKARSNRPEQGTAADTYVKVIKPTVIDMLRVGAHYAVASLFAKDPEHLNLYSFKAASDKYELLEAGRQKLAIGRAKIRSIITWEQVEITFGILHLGDHQLFGGVREFISKEAFEKLHLELATSFNRGSINEVIMLLDKYFESHNYSFWHLFKDDQKKILSKVLRHTLNGIENDLQHVYDNNYPLMLAMSSLNLPLPRPLYLTLEYVVNTKLKRELTAQEVDINEIKKLFREAARMNIVLNLEVMEYEAAQLVARLATQLEEKIDNIYKMHLLVNLLNTLKDSPLKPDYWHAQNTVFRLKNTVYQHFRNLSKKNDEVAVYWCEKFDELFDKLNFKA
ncbi:DUF3536 domain-containing protein [Pontibacter sp. SGAir0037]|uniref:DUF3536 domain-containing protein n=1 Tax=Pontibacter sp. SGAir0037 TaxID=2571030 RepID=UPI0010CD2DCC|nr:DUF3536 domain-containing protein [Pontibacter sp. SGAir0037]QCR22797.1 glycoside hydrolase [Pontibacter sp. SGAir0037]